MKYVGFRHKNREQLCARTTGVEIRDIDRMLLNPSKAVPENIKYENGFGKTANNKCKLLVLNTYQQYDTERRQAFTVSGR